jgi:hypothetical protein
VLLCICFAAGRGRERDEMSGKMTENGKGENIN